MANCPKCGGEWYGNDCPECGQTFNTRGIGKPTPAPPKPAPAPVAVEAAE